MNKRTRLIVSLLFAVVILMAAAITRFYVSVPKNTAVNGGGDENYTILETDGNGYSVFSDSAGLCGIIESGRIAAAPEWLELRFAGDDKCIASKKIGGQVKRGCINFEGNVVVPLVYSSIEKKEIGGKVLYFAVSAEDQSCVVYSSDFTPYFGTAWSSCTINEDELTLNDEYGSYVYSVNEEGFYFKRAAVKGDISGDLYELNIYSRLLLSKLTPAMIEKMTSATEKYISYAYSGDKELLSSFGGDTRQFRRLYPDSDEITRKKLVSLPEMHVYSSGTEDGIPVYEVSVSAETEITYINEVGEHESFTDESRAAVRFRGSSIMDLEAVSGAFESEIPEYPRKEEPTEPVYIEEPSSDDTGIAASVPEYNDYI